MWILCKWDFKNVNFVKNGIFKLWILWKVWFSNYEFCENCEFFDKLRIFAWVCLIDHKIRTKTSGEKSSFSSLLFKTQNITQHSKDVAQLHIFIESVSKWSSHS